MTPAVRASGLVHRFGPVEALRGVSFEVAPGEIFGLLGPNGAGKTTTMRILLTLLRPEAGRATVAGLDVVADAGAVRHTVGWVPQERAVDPLLSARENLRLRPLAQLNPMTHAIEAVRSLILNGWPVADLLRQVGYLAAFSLVAIALATWVLRRGLH